jgi:DHA3 family macrolide efflux protein-like MFS transporter
VVVSLSTLMTPLGLAIAGPFSDAMGIRTWYWVAGLVCLLMGIASFFMPIVMNVETNRVRNEEPAGPPAVPSIAD